MDNDLKFKISELVDLCSGVSLTETHLVFSGDISIPLNKINHVSFNSMYYEIYGEGFHANVYLSGKVTVEKIVNRKRIKKLLYGDSSCSKNA